MKGKFQYQYRYQYFEIPDFNINIDMTNILVFQYFSIYCPTSAIELTTACDPPSWQQRFFPTMVFGSGSNSCASPHKPPKARICC